MNQEPNKDQSINIKDNGNNKNFLLRYEMGYSENLFKNMIGYMNKYYLFRSFNNYTMETKSLLTSFFVKEDKEIRFIEAARFRNVKNSKI